MELRVKESINTAEWIQAGSQKERESLTMTPTGSDKAIGFFSLKAEPNDFLQENMNPNTSESRVLKTKMGRTIEFFFEKRSVWVQVTETIGSFTRSMRYPVKYKQNTVSERWNWLCHAPSSEIEKRMHFMQNKTSECPKFFFLGELGLKGGGDPFATKRSPLRRSISTLLRQQITKSDISDTEALVEAINHSQDDIEGHEFHEWVQNYITWFSKQPIEALSSKIIREYTQLCWIHADGKCQRDLLHDWFCSLCNQIQQGHYGERKLIEALDCALQIIDPRIFGQDPSQLIKLSRQLLSKLNPAEVTFTRETFPTLGVVLSALNQTMLLIQQVAPNQLDPSQSVGIYQTFKKQLASIKTHAHYYPFVYEAKRIENSLQQLEMDNSAQRFRRRRLLAGVIGTLLIYKGMRSIVDFDFDLDAFTRGFEQLSDAFSYLAAEAKPWTDWICALNRICLQSYQSQSARTTFWECYTSLKEKCFFIKVAQDRKALRFGMIQQLLALALHGPNEETKQKSIEELIQLAELCKTEKSWKQDPEIIEALLDALGMIFIHTENPIVRVFLEILVSMEEKNVANIVNEWLSGLTFEEKLMALPKEDTENESGTLFRMIRKEIMVEMRDYALPEPQLHEMTQSLIQLYQKPQFTKMEALFQGEKPIHVSSMQSHLLVLEQAREDKKEEESFASPEIDEDQIAYHHETHELVKTPISPQELFKDRVIESDGPVVEINKVLITGDPGTGKTTLARNLAYQWSVGEWGHAFDVVFVLNVRELQASKYDDANERREETLATAIANHCFSRRDKDAFLSLRKQITEVLEKPSTLLILDGLDESAGASQAILSEAKNCSCKLLMLSRPYGFQRDRGLADIEVILEGLNDEQLENWIQKGLSTKDAQNLIEFLRSTPIIWKIAHVPVNAQILCTLWREPHLRSSKKPSNNSLSMLYRRMTHFTWERYLQKQKEETADSVDVFDTLGQIAFEALVQGQILIDEWLVEENTRTGWMKRLLKESGFLLLKSVGLQYQFPHLTFQEYFAGRWLARRLRMGSAAERETVKDILARHKYDTEFTMVWSFMMGEISLMRKTEGATELLKVIQENPKDVVGIKQLLLELRLMNDYLETDAGSALPQSEAPRKMIEVLRACQKEYQLCSLLLNALEGFPNLFQTFPELLNPIFEMCEWTDKKFRTLAMKSMATILQFAPKLLPVAKQRSEEIFLRADKFLKEEIVYMIRRIDKVAPRMEILEFAPLIIKACNDEEHHVRESALIGITNIAMHVPIEKIPSLLNLLKKGCDDEFYSARQTALHSVRKIIELCPKYIPLLLDKFVMAFSDPYQQVRKAAHDICKKVIEWSPRHTRPIVLRLNKTLQDVNENVRKFGVEAADLLLPLLGKEGLLLIETLGNLITDRSAMVQEAALIAVRHVIDVASESYPSLLDKLEKGLESQRHLIRKTSIQALASALLNGSVEQRARIKMHLQKSLADDDFQVRIAAIEAAGELIELDASELGTFQETMLQACQDDVSNVRKSAVEVIGNAVRSFEEIPPPLLEQLKAACYDSFTNVRKTALALLKISCLNPDVLWADVETKTRDFAKQTVHVKKGLIEIVNEWIPMTPEKLPELLDLLFVALDDPNAQILTLAIQSLRQVAEVAETHRTILIEKLFNALMHNSPVVQKEAKERIFALLQKHPELGFHILPSAQENTTAKEAKRRVLSLNLLGEIGRLNPDQFVEIIPNILQGCNDDSAHVIRVAALDAINEALKTDILLFGEFLEVLQTLAKDFHSRVRTKAIQVMGTAFAMPSAPYSDFVEYVLIASKDTSFSVRKAAYDVIEKATFLHPECIQPFLDPLLRAFGNPNTVWRHNSKEILESLPLESLIEGFWNIEEENKPHLAFVLVSRLYQTPVTVFPCKNEESTLTLRLHTTRKVEIIKNKEDIQNLQSMIQRTFSKRLQNIQQITI